jgi:hypothetical protein
MARTNFLSFFISEMATIIANNPQLRYLDVTYLGSSRYGITVTLRDLFSKLSAKNPLRLEQLYTSNIDAAVDQVTLPHLTQLTSFRFNIYEGVPFITRSVWTSLLVNNVTLSDVTIGNVITKETMLHLSSFTGLKRLDVIPFTAPPDMTLESLENMFFTEVLPKHVNSLEVLMIAFDQWVKFLLLFSAFFSPSLIASGRLSIPPAQSRS